MNSVWQRFCHWPVLSASRASRVGKMMESGTGAATAQHIPCLTGITASEKIHTGTCTCKLGNVDP